MKLKILAKHTLELYYVMEKATRQRPWSTQKLKSILKAK